MVTTESSSDKSVNKQAIIDAITLQMEKIIDAKLKPINDQLKAKGKHPVNKLSSRKESNLEKRWIVESRTQERT
ncbi:unnamed protein product [Arabidopsis thaliana]|uniref:(thale cress) hypothetical protein n=1 Tax=Arabidopsis thaliana TaxID=3702 RepID=A0A7G2EU43_ARATH|nr:unnamed protein product [Arabidopsis thaliana]